MPNVKGMSGMDAVALLGNLGLKVKIIGVGKVKNNRFKREKFSEKYHNIFRIIMMYFKRNFI